MSFILIHHIYTWIIILTTINFIIKIGLLHNIRLIIFINKLIISIILI